MDKNLLLEKIIEIEKIPSNEKNWSENSQHSFYITVKQFVKNYIGTETEFYKTLESYSANNSSYHESNKASSAKKVLKSLRDYLSLDLEIYRSAEYIVKYELINDFLIQTLT